ncbi:MAG TPA: hypothetical protein VFW85_10970 [Gaiellaceae bacterium]|nr:hypothetical protein [Gaiellaceae bacterium]
MSRSVRRAVSFALVAYGLTLGSCAPAFAGSPITPPPVSSIQQYSEAVPGSTGSVATGGKGRRTLPPKLARKIRRHGGAESDSLRRLVTSAAFGAPQAALGQSLPATAANEVDPTPAVSAAGVGAAADTLTDAKSKSVLAVLIAIGLSSLGGVAVGRRRLVRRR